MSTDYYYLVNYLLEHFVVIDEDTFCVFSFCVNGLFIVLNELSKTLSI